MPSNGQPTTGQVQDYATQVAGQYNLDPAIFLSMLRQESGFNVNARGSSGEIGPGQLLPSTAAQMNVNPNDWQQNIVGSARYLNQMLNLSGGDYSMALAGYNGGPAVASGNRAPKSSTQDYVSNILGSLGDSFTKFRNDPMTQKFIGTPGSGNQMAAQNRDWEAALVRFFSLNTGIRLAAVVIGVILILAAVFQLISGTKFVKGVVTTAKTAALAA